MSAERFGAALAALMGELDWPRLERLYCEGEAAGFFSEPQRDALLDASLRLASDVAGQLPPGAPPRSVYVGAAVAELAPILCESLVLGREVRWLNLPGEESEELARSLAAVEARLLIPLPRIETGGLRDLPRAAFGHLWLVSVLTDPGTFPALHDRLYGRAGTDLATGRGDPAGETARAGALLDEALARLAATALVSTTDEELPLVEVAARRAGIALAPAAHARLSPIVGDPVRLCLATRVPRPPRAALP